jgi:membrane protein YqaA with SNARE-associated domain
MIRTWFFCTVGGVFSVCWANLLARRPALWKLHRVVAGGTIGAVVGYYVHRYEEEAEDRYKQMIEKGQKLPKWLLQSYQPRED